MHPTALGASVAPLVGILSLASFPCDATGHQLQSRVQVIDREPDAQPARVCESTNGLRDLVEESTRGLGPGGVTVDELLRRLEITLRLPSALARLPAHEQLVAIDRTGRVIGFADGTRSTVDAGPVLKRVLPTDQSVVLIHNHSAGGGLALQDLGQLTKPGVSAVIAVGHDGSLYAASIGETFMSLQPEGGVTVAAFSIMHFVIRAQKEIHNLAAMTFGLNQRVFSSHSDHVISLVLREAGVIRYRCVLSAARRVSFNRFRIEFLRIIEEVRQKLAADIERQVPAIR